MSRNDPRIGHQIFSAIDTISNGDSGMNLYNRMAMTIVRIVAAGFLLVGILDLAADWFKSHHNHVEISVWSWVVSSILIAIGVAILVKSSALAEWVDQYLDD